MKKLSKKLTSRWSLKAPLYLKDTDKRYAGHLKQLQTNGFSDAETWGLDAVISEFILPRLIRFKEVNNGIPYGLTSEHWDAILDQMIFSFEWNIHHEDEKYDVLTEDERNLNWDKYKLGMDKFSKHFRDLWW